MVKAMINISKQANQILNIVKARYNLKTKSEAINLFADKCGAEYLKYEKKNDKKSRRNSEKEK